MIHETLAELTFRGIRAADLPLLRDFVRDLSRDTAYKRLLSGRMPTEDELRSWTSIDHSREGAVVATTRTATGERLVGVARYVVQTPYDTDFAIVLADAWQRQGLGHALMQRLIDAARQQGVRRLGGITLPTNTAMLTLARALGFRSERVPGGMTTLLTLDLP